MADDELRPGISAVARFQSSNDDEGMLTGSLFSLGSTTIGIEVDIPLDKRQRVEERDIAARELDILEEQRSFQMEEIAEEVRSSYLSYESNRISLGIETERLADAKENLRIAERMVEEGEADNRDVLSAQEALVNAESGIISAKTDLYLATMELRYAMGEDLTTMGSR
jgi:outer membrane protein TolC